MAILKKEEREIVTVQDGEFARDCGLEIVYSPMKGLNLSTVNINRPGLLLSGYNDFFAESRIQVLGMNEITYLGTLDKKIRRERLETLFSMGIPCLIISRNQKIAADILELAEKYLTPVFKSAKVTAALINDLYIYLNEMLAPVTTIHGILLDVYGIGVLITGKSGIGKSETALELIHRGHRLVSDDVVNLKEIESCLYGSSPEVTEHMMEIRGVGIIDIKAMYGVGAVLKSKRVQIIIELEKWDPDKEYNRVGSVVEKENILGVNVPKYRIPVISGRNIAVLIEVAVRDFRLKEEGYNSLAEIERRMI